jgi:hypothetical protein
MEDLFFDALWLGMEGGQAPVGRFSSIVWAIAAQKSLLLAEILKAMQQQPFHLICLQAMASLWLVVP